MAESKFSRKLVIDRRYYELPDFISSVVCRTAGGDGIVIHDPSTDQFVPYSGVKMTDDELRFYLTYFDQIDAPCIPGIDYSDHNMEYLESVDFLTRTTYPLEDDGGYCWPVDEFLPDFSYAPDWALRDLTVKEPGQWSLATRGRKFSSDDVIEGGALELDLFSCLPVPVADTPFDDILTFKERYVGELDRLRLGLYDLSENASRSADSFRAAHAARSALQIALSDLVKAMKGQSIVSNLITLKTEFSVGDIGKIGVTTSALAATGTPIEIATGAGVASGFLKFNIGAKPKMIAGADVPMDFAYIAEMNSKLRLD